MTSVLYTTALSANGRKTLAVARHLGLDIDVRTVDVYRGEGQTEAYRAINPWGKIPTLVDGDVVLWESNAILVYLSEMGATPALFATGSKGRAGILKWLFWESSHWQPVLSRVLAPRVSQVLFQSDASPAAVPWEDPELRRQLAILESELSAHEHVAGEQLSIADFSVAGMTTYFRVAGFPGASYPAVSAWLQRMAALPAWASTAISPWV